MSLKMNAGLMAPHLLVSDSGQAELSRNDNGGNAR